MGASRIFLEGELENETVLYSRISNRRPSR